MNDPYDLRVTSLHMLPPLQLQDGTFQRQAGQQLENADKLIRWESLLRRQAYKNTTIQTGPDFFNDSDMKSKYFITVVYEEKSGTPLLSARYYSDRDAISGCLNGDSGHPAELRLAGKNFDIFADLNQSFFLADRLSGNTGSVLYRYKRSEIFSLYYSEMLATCRNSKLLLMVRRVKRDRQIERYFNIGFSLLGSTVHKGREHSIIMREME